MTTKPTATTPEGDALPPTTLAELRDLAKARIGAEPDKAGPAAVRAMAAIVRDLKGMPEILVSREHTHKIKLQRKGKVGALTIEFQPKISIIEIGFLNFADADPTTTKLQRYTFAADKGPSGEWQRLDDGGELFQDVRQTLLKLYPELGAG
ncbi:MAG: hypothetical protein IPK82_13795 [Polyangiaceae bacterium]|nr:hypothetical protein [Polyangiaceae bacterium]